MRCCLLLLILPLFLNAELTWHSDLQKPFSISLKLNSDTIRLDEFLYLEAEFHYPSSYHLNIDALIEQLGWSANPLSPLLTVYHTEVSPKQEVAGVISQKLHAVVRPLTEGNLSMSFLNISFQPKEKEEKTIGTLTPVFTIHVTSLGENEPIAFAPLMPLEPEFPLGLTEANKQFLWESPERQEAEKKYIQKIISQHTFPWVGLMVLLGLGGIGWTAYLMKDLLPKLKKKERPAFSPKQQAEIALQNLLKDRSVHSLTPFEASQFSFILLKALEEPIKRSLKELTSQEIVCALQKETSISQEIKKPISTFLSEMDQIKFACKKPSIEETEALIQKIQLLIKQTESKLSK